MSPDQVIILRIVPPTSHASITSFINIESSTVNYSLSTC